MPDPVDSRIAGLPARKRFAEQWEASTETLKQQIREAPPPEAAAQQQGLDGVWKTLSQAGCGGIESTQPPSAKQARTVSLGPIRQRGLDTLVGWIRDSRWDSKAGDIAPQLITSLPDWPAGRSLEVSERGRPTYLFGARQFGPARDPEPVRVVRENNHYAALVNGKREDVPGDGNCFFHAVARAFGGSADALRQGLAEYMEKNPEKVAQWVDLEKIATSLSRPSGAGVLRLVAALEELGETAAAHRREGRVGALLNDQLFYKCARKHGVKAKFLFDRLNLMGELKIEGAATVQSHQMKKGGALFRRIDKKFLNELQALARHPVSPSRLDNKKIIEIGMKENVRIRELRKKIDVTGNLIESGKKISKCVHDRITPAILREFLLLGSNMSLEIACAKKNIAHNNALRYINGLGLTYSGINLLWREELKRNSLCKKEVTVEALIELKNSGAEELTDAEILEYSIKTAMSPAQFGKYIYRDRTLKNAGRDFLERHRPQVSEPPPTAVDEPMDLSRPAGAR